MKTVLKNLFAPLNFSEDEEKKRISRILYLFWLSTCALVGINVIGILFVFVRKSGASIVVAFFILILIIVRFFHWRGNIRLASFLFVFGLWIAYMTVTLLSGTIRTSIIAIPVALTAMVILLLGLQAGMVSAILTLLVTLGLTILEIMGYPLPSYFPRSPLSNWFHLVTAFTIVMVPLGYAWKEISNALIRIQKEKEFTDHALNSLKDIFFVFNPKTRKAVRWNRAINEITGYNDDELATLKTPDHFFSKGDVKNAENAMQEVLNEKFVSIELCLITKSGQTIPTEYTVTSIRDENDQVQYLIAIGRDIRERQKAKIAIQKSENKHRLLFEEANDGIFIIKDNRFTECNTKILEMFRADREDILGKRPHELSPDFQPNGKRTAVMEQEMLQAALAGERQVFEWRHLRKDNTEFDVEVSLNLLDLDKELFVQSIVRDITERKQAEKKLAEAYETTLEGWAKALELRDKETKDHSQRVVELTVLLAQAMGFEEDDLSHIRRGAILHDIGKMGIPDKILRKPGKLTPSERKIIEQHPIYSFELLSRIPYLEKSIDIPYCHHERWDGTGYPQGLKGEEIPLTARIFAVIDVWDALQSDRPYGKPWRREDVIAHIRDESGKHFDPEVVTVFLNLVEKGEV